MVEFVCGVKPIKHVAIQLIRFTGNAAMKLWVELMDSCPPTSSVKSVYNAVEFPDI